MECPVKFTLTWSEMWFSMIKISWNALKFSWKNVLSYSFVQFRNVHSEIRKFPEKPHLCLISYRLIHQIKPKRNLENNILQVLDTRTSQHWWILEHFWCTNIAQSVIFTFFRMWWWDPAANNTGMPKWCNIVQYSCTSIWDLKYHIFQNLSLWGLFGYSFYKNLT